VVWAKAGMATSAITAMTSATVRTNKTLSQRATSFYTCGSRLRRWLRPPLRHPSLGAGFLASTLPLQ
jgi:hypothetical protein